MEKVKIFTFPPNEEMEMKSALGFLECYRSPKEVEEIKKLAEDIKESGGESWILLFMMALFGFND